LRVWRVADSPTYPIGFPLATAFAAGGIVSLFAIYLYVRRNSWILEYGLSGRDAVEDDLSPVVWRLVTNLLLLEHEFDKYIWLVRGSRQTQLWTR
jgi:hypothetical protein